MKPHNKAMPGLTDNEIRAIDEANAILDSLGADAHIDYEQFKQRKEREGHRSAINALNNMVMHFSHICYPANIGEFVESLRVMASYDPSRSYPKTMEYCSGLIRRDARTKYGYDGYRYRSLSRVLKTGTIEPGGVIREAIMPDEYSAKKKKDDKHGGASEEPSPKMTREEIDNKCYKILVDNTISLKTNRFR